MRAQLRGEVFLHILESHGGREHVDGKEVEERQVLVGVGILTIRPRGGEEEEHQYEHCRGDEDRPHLDDSLLVEHEEHAGEEEEKHTLLHDGEGTHQTGDDDGDELPQRHLRVAPESHHEQHLVEHVGVVEETVVFVTIHRQHTDVVEHVGTVEHHHHLHNLVEIEWGDDHRDDIEQVEESLVDVGDVAQRLTGMASWQHVVGDQGRGTEDGEPQGKAGMELVAERVEQVALKQEHHLDGEPDDGGNRPWREDVAQLEEQEGGKQQTHDDDKDDVHLCLGFVFFVFAES